MEGGRRKEGRERQEEKGREAERKRGRKAGQSLMA